MAEELILETKGLTKVYNGIPAVNEVNMHIHRGDIYGFVGENGAGKTTIIRMVAGLAKPTKGSFVLFGAESGSKNLAMAKSKIGGIVESVSLNKGMTAMENLRLQCAICGVNRSDEELHGLLEKVGLGDVPPKKKANQFSLGMRQRLGIASTLISNPEFILLDEPMNGLDPQGFIDVRELILKLNQEGVTFLVSSHILSELDKVCTRVGFISRGHLLEELSMEDLRAKSRRKILVSAKNNQDLRVLLEKALSLQDIQDEGNGLAIYDEIDINKAMRLLVEKGVEVSSINVVEETIEDYYAKLMVRGLNQ